MVNYHNEMMTLTCDECGAEFKLSCFNFFDGIQQAKKAGWKIIKTPEGEWEHYCTEHN